MVLYIPGSDRWFNAGSGFAEGLAKGYKESSDNEALKNAVSKLGPDASPQDVLKAIIGTRTYNPESKKQLFESYLGTEKFKELQRHNKAIEEKTSSSYKTPPSEEEHQRNLKNLMDQGFLQEEAETILSPHVTPGVKQAVSSVAKDKIARGERVVKGPGIEEIQDTVTEEIQPSGVDVGVKESVTSVTPPKDAPKEVVETSLIEDKPEKIKWEKIPEPLGQTGSEREKWRQSNQKENSKLLQEVEKKVRSSESNLIRLNRASALNNSGKLPSGLGRLVINPTTGEPYSLASLGESVNKETQAFVKTINDFTAEAKNFFGGRVTNFEVGTFKSRLPTLMNTEEGRRIIIEQMRLMEELQNVYDTTMSSALKHYDRNASYPKISEQVDEKVAERQKDIIDRINNIDEASNYLDKKERDPRLKDMKLIQAPDGKFKYMPANKVQEAKSRGYRIW